MPLIATITAAGLHLRTHPTGRAPSIDILTKGDEITIDDTTAEVGGWLYGRVSKIKNGVSAKDRTQQCGWFFAEGYASVRSEPAEPKYQAQDTRRKPLLLAIWGAIAALVSGAIWLFAR